MSERSANGMVFYVLTKDGWVSRAGFEVAPGWAMENQGPDMGIDPPDAWTLTHLHTGQAAATHPFDSREDALAAFRDLVTRLEAAGMKSDAEPSQEVLRRAGEAFRAWRREVQTRA